MLYREIIAVCSQIHTKHRNTLCGQNVEFVDVKPVTHLVTTGLIWWYFSFWQCSLVKPPSSDKWHYISSHELTPSKTKASRSSETSVNFHQTTKRHILQTYNHHNHHSQRPRSRKLIVAQPIINFPSFYDTPEIFRYRTHNISTTERILSHTNPFHTRYF
jgi:hypothetical protein